MTNEWFVEERLHIGARCSGAMERLLTLAVEWATERVQFDERIYDFQGVSFPLADSAADASAARLLTREAAVLMDEGAEPQGRPRQGVARQAVRVRGGVALRGSRRPGVRRPRLHARVPRRAVPARAPGGPHLGGHVRDPAADHRAGAREARRRRRRRLSRGVATRCPRATSPAIDLRPLFAPRSIAVVGASPRSTLAPHGPRQPPADGQRDALPLRQPATTRRSRRSRATRRSTRCRSGRTR